MKPSFAKTIVKTIVFGTLTGFVLCFGVAILCALLGTRIDHYGILPELVVFALPTTLLAASLSHRHHRRLWRSDRGVVLPPNQTFMTKDPTARYKLYVSEDCGCSYRLHAEEVNPTAFHTTLSRLDREGHRWYVRKPNGDSDETYTCKVYRDIVANCTK